MNFLKRKKEKIVVNIKVKLEIGFLKKLKINLKKKIHQLNKKRNKGLKQVQNPQFQLIILITLVNKKLIKDIKRKKQPEE